MNPKGLEYRWLLANILFVKLMLTKCGWEETNMPLDDTSIIGKYLLAFSQRPLTVRLHTHVGTSSSALESLGRLSQSGGPIWRKQYLYFQLLSVWEAEVGVEEAHLPQKVGLDKKVSVTPFSKDQPATQIVADVNSGFLCKSPSHASCLLHSVTP